MSEEEYDDDNQEQEQIRVIFTTKHKDVRVPETTIALPTRLTRKGLSEVINHLLDKEDESVPFDFLLIEKNILVRQSLEKHIKNLNISRESVLKIEYAPALKEPQLDVEQELPDWIACVDSRTVIDSTNQSVVAGTYDGKIQLAKFNTEKKTLQTLDTFQAHAAAVKTVRQFSNEYMVSGGKDGSLFLYKVAFENKTCSGVKIGHLAGHVGSVESCDAARLDDFAVVLSGGWDKSVCLWKVKLDAEQDPANEPAAKTRKSKRNGGASPTEVQQHSPSSILLEHSANVSAITWASSKNPSIAYSGSWDYSIRAWDLARESSIMHFNGTKVVTSLDCSEQANLLASGHADCAVRLWDTRDHGDEIVKMKLSSHNGWVSAVKWFGPHLLLSASHDHTIKVWDIRSTVPLYTINAHGNKVFSIDTVRNSVVSGGADAILRSHTIA